MNPTNIIDALETWGFQPAATPEHNIISLLSDINDDHEMGYTEDDIKQHAPLILAWLRDPTVIDPDPDERSDIEWAQYVNRIHG